MGIRRRRAVGLHRVGPVGFESRFPVLGTRRQHDGSEERVVHRDASRESTGGIRVVFCFELKNRSRLPLGWVVSDIRIHARARDPSSRHPTRKLRHRFTAKRTDYLHDRLLDTRNSTSTRRRIGIYQSVTSRENLLGTTATGLVPSTCIAEEKASPYICEPIRAED